MEELAQIEQKYKILLQKAIEIMKEVPDSKHSLSHMESVVQYTKEILETVEEADKEECIQTNCRFHKILELLPSLRKDLLKLECSKEIFDREIGKLVVYLHDRIFGVGK